MSQPNCTRPIPLATLVEYWLDEVDKARELEIDEHLLGCAVCSANLESLVDIARGVHTAARTGAVQAVITDAFVKRLAEHGLRVREYRVPHDGSVYCTVAPDDDLLVSRLGASLAGVDRLDVEFLGERTESRNRVCDVPFDAAAGEVVIAFRMDVMRALPASTQRIRLVAVEPGGERRVGEYTFNHTPWPGSNGD